MVLLLCAVILGLLGIIPYSPLSLVLSTIYITFFCWVTNVIFSKVFKAPTNTESLYITALILVFLISPIDSFGDTHFYSIAFWASVFAMASKYVLALQKKHIFNPAAISVVLTSIVLGLSATWWIGTTWMIVPVIVCGLLMARKVDRIDFVIAFFVASIAVVVLPHISGGLGEFWLVLKQFIFFSPTIFFASIMLTEPLTTPPNKRWRIAYGTLVGLLFSPAIHMGAFYSTPELALIVGNVFSYIVSPKEKLLLKLKEKIKIASDTYDFVFAKAQKFSFQAGQYLEWTLAHKSPDTRGNRRYFTITSSPTEENIRIGVKFYPEGSSFKKKLMSLDAGDTIVASQRAGEFVLPKDKNKKLVFISGGIGITPFRSIAKYLLDVNEKRDIVHFYSNRTLEDIAYSDVLDMTHEKLGIQTVYTLTDKETAPTTWLGEKGFVDRAMIEKYVPDFKERIFYISGPHSMVTTFGKLLSSMGVKGSQIKEDFFPGYA
jgi:ferredoxin-NADP reductase